MAKYEHLPIYRKSFDLAVVIERLVHGFSRHHKYGIGARLQHRLNSPLGLTAGYPDRAPRGRGSSATCVDAPTSGDTRPPHTALTLLRRAYGAPTLLRRAYGAAGEGCGQDVAGATSPEGFRK